MKILLQDGAEIINIKNFRRLRLDHWMNFELDEEEQNRRLGTNAYIKSTIIANPVRDHDNEDGLNGTYGILLGWYYNEEQAERAFSILWQAISSDKSFLDMREVYEEAKESLNDKRE